MARISARGIAGMAGIQARVPPGLARPESGAWIVLISAAIFGVIAGAVLFVVFIVLTFIARDRRRAECAGRRQTEFSGFLRLARSGASWARLDPALPDLHSVGFGNMGFSTANCKFPGTFGRKARGNARCPRRGLLHERARSAARRASGRKSSVGARGAPCAALQFPLRPLFLPSRLRSREAPQDIQPRNIRRRARSGPRGTLPGSAESAPDRRRRRGPPAAPEMLRVRTPASHRAAVAGL